MRDCPSKLKENPKEPTLHLTTGEPRRKLSKGQKDKLRRKRKKAREYLDNILSSDSAYPKSSSECSGADKKTNFDEKQKGVCHQTNVKPDHGRKANVSNEFSGSSENSSLFDDRRDCQWVQITYVDEFGQIKSKMDWFPMSN